MAEDYVGDLRGAGRGRAAAPGARADGVRSRGGDRCGRRRRGRARARRSGRRSRGRDGLATMPTFGTAADDEVVSLHEQFYIQATSSRADDRTRVLKHGRDLRGVRSLRRRAARRPGRAGHLPRRHAVPVAAGAAHRRSPPAAAVVDGEEGKRSAHRRSRQRPISRIRAASCVLPRGTLHVFRTQVPVAELLLRTAACLELRDDRGRRRAGDELQRRLRRHLRGARLEAGAPRNAPRARRRTRPRHARPTRGSTVWCGGRASPSIRRPTS